MPEAASNPVAGAVPDRLSADAESALVARARSGDPNAFGELVLQNQDRVYNMILRLVSQPEDAADITQEVFLTAYRKLATFRQNARFYTWIYRIATNAAFSLLRKRATRREVPDPPEIAADRPAAQDGVSARMEEQDRANAVQAALAAIDDDHRAVVVLRDVEGLPYDRIGAILDIAEGTVKSRLHRGRAALRDRLKELMT